MVIKDRLYPTGKDQGINKMRLICPNCGAQYEVAEDVIPDEGRDVQCSSCGHTWLEKPGASSIEDAFADVQPAITDPQTDDVADTWVSEDMAEPSPPAPPAAEPEPSAPQRQELDPAIADILREEAAREAEARKLEAQATIEVQPDLDLSQDPEPAPDPQKAEAERRIATLKGEEAATMAAAATRRELLPDIEEINSSLRPNSERDEDTSADTTDVEKKPSSGFRRGFLATIGLLVFALLIYILAPRIAQAVPATASALQSYVDWVDVLRLWVDVKLQGLLAAIST